MLFRVISNIASNSRVRTYQLYLKFTTITCFVSRNIIVSFSYPQRRNIFRCVRRPVLCHLLRCMQRTAHTIRFQPDALAHRCEDILNDFVPDKRVSVRCAPFAHAKSLKRRVPEGAAPCILEYTHRFRSVCNVFFHDYEYNGPYRYMVYTPCHAICSMRTSLPEWLRFY